MANYSHSDQLFAGPWDIFVLCYPDVAAQYSAKQQSGNECGLSVAKQKHTIVLYCIATQQSPLKLSEYQHMIVEGAMVVIIVAPFVKIHIFDAVLVHNITVDLVLEKESYCVYEHDFTNSNADVIERTSVVTAHDNARLHYYVLYAGSSSITQRYYSHAQGRGAQIALRGIFCATGDQKMIIESLQNHTSVDTQSEVLLRGFVADAATLCYKGTIAIDAYAVNTQARQEHKTLLLSDKASVESVPVLEVLNKEVQCSHASAIGKLDEQALLYLQSRGLDRVYAQQMLLLNYIASVYGNEHNLFSINQKIPLLINNFNFL